MCKAMAKRRCWRPPAAMLPCGFTSRWEANLVDEFFANDALFRGGEFITGR